MFGLPPHITRRLYTSGSVRWYKTGDDQRATTLVNVDDLEEWIVSKQQGGLKHDHSDDNPGGNAGRGLVGSPA
jgi:hypothetical protein